MDSNKQLAILKEHYNTSTTNCIVASRNMCYWKIRIIFWHRRFTLKVQFSHFATRPPFSWSIYIISRLIIHLTATYSYSKMYLILWNVGIYSSSFSWYQRLNRKGLSDKRSAVGFCLGSGLFGSYNSD